jgi:histidine triad (HIT) family protein
MQLTPEQQKAIDQQKEQCIFCQIIAGKIETKKVYEDKLLIGILDINPAAKGHVLFMPKEHYPIMPLIPEETFKQLVNKTKEVDKCVKEAMLCKETTIFIANGAAAGQQSSHFMLHIIPRDGGLEVLDIKGKEAKKEETEEMTAKLGSYLDPLLKKNLAALGYIEKSGLDELPFEKLLAIIESNPQLKQIILERPEDFKKLAEKHPQLSKLFKGKNTDKIIEEVKKRSSKEPKKFKIEDILK